MPTSTPNPDTNKPFAFGRLPRLTSWWLIAAVLSVAVLFLAPGQLAVTTYKINLVAISAVVGYWIDRKTFPYARPDLKSLELLKQPQPVPAFEPPSDYFGMDDPTPIEGDHAMSHSFVSLVDYAPLYFLAAVMLRRALIASATVLAVALGA